MLPLRASRRPESDHVSAASRMATLLRELALTAFVSKVCCMVNGMEAPALLKIQLGIVQLVEIENATAFSKDACITRRWLEAEGNLDRLCQVQRGLVLLQNLQVLHGFREGRHGWC